MIIIPFNVFLKTDLLLGIGGGKDQETQIGKCMESLCYSSETMSQLILTTHWCWFRNSEMTEILDNFRFRLNRIERLLPRISSRRSFQFDSISSELIKKTWMIQIIRLKKTHNSSATLWYSYWRKLFKNFVNPHHLCNLLRLLF